MKAAHARFESRREHGRARSAGDRRPQFGPEHAEPGDVEPIAGGEYDVIETSRAAAVEFDFHAVAAGDGVEISTPAVTRTSPKRGRSHPAAPARRLAALKAARISGGASRTRLGTSTSQLSGNGPTAEGACRRADSLPRIGCRQPPACLLAPSQRIGPRQMISASAPASLSSAAVSQALCPRPITATRLSRKPSKSA